MQKGITGKDIEERLQTRLESWSFLQRDPVLDHEYKLDFVILNFKGIPRYGQSIGVQVTVNESAGPKQADFLRVHQSESVVPKAVFLEVNSQANLDAAATLACFALGTFAFGIEHRDRKLIGLRIGKDLSSEFFDLEENIKRLAEEESAKSSPAEKEKMLAGEIRRYNRQRGFGFVVRLENHEKLFFHRTHIMDPKLEYELDHRPGTTCGEPGKEQTVFQDPIRVYFDGGGFKDGETRPKAVNIRMFSQPALVE